MRIDPALAALTIRAFEAAPGDVIRRLNYDAYGAGIHPDLLAVDNHSTLTVSAAPALGSWTPHRQDCPCPHCARHSQAELAAPGAPSMSRPLRISGTAAWSSWRGDHHSEPAVWEVPERRRVYLVNASDDDPRLTVAHQTELERQDWEASEQQRRLSRVTAVYDSAGARRSLPFRPRAFRPTRVQDA